MRPFTFTFYLATPFCGFVRFQGSQLVLIGALGPVAWQRSALVLQDHRPRTPSPAFSVPLFDLINLPGLICRSLHVFAELSDAVAFVLAAYEEAEAIIFMFYKKGLITGNMHGESPFKVWNTIQKFKTIKQFQDEIPPIGKNEGALVQCEIERARASEEAREKLILKLRDLARKEALIGSGRVSEKERLENESGPGRGVKNRDSREGCLLQNGENGHRSIEEDDGHSEVKVKCT
ncbi:hypothetical protein BGZ57DRAFT_860721 [Hyaloscypha finlandica]|nr:hypothetical protein BGZ57DRAFT_860721 [Hyaloscypha finlandica]